MKIPLFGLGVASRSPFITAKQLQNIYVEQRPAGEKSQYVGIGTAGLDLFISFGDTPVRGWIVFEADDVFYAVHRGTLYEVNNAGVKTSIGSLLTTSGKCHLSHNGTQIFIVDGTYGYTYNTSTDTFAQVTDIDFPTAPETNTFQDGYSIINQGGTGRFYISDGYDSRAWDSLDFANAETSPDPLVRVLADHGELLLFGTTTTEFWGNNGAADFPYSRIAATEWGLAAVDSLAKFDNSVACLVKNRMGQVMIAKFSGYVPQKISTPDIDAIINGYSAVSDASGYSYMLGGHPMYVINFPSAGYSWLYDGSTGIWTSLKSYGLTRHRAEMSLDYLNQTLISDYANGNVYKLRPNVLTDNGDPIERELISENIAGPDLERIGVDCLRLDMQTGNGTATGQGSNPQVMLQVSRDNGNTYGAEMWRTSGAIGKYNTCVEWRRLGALPQGGAYVFKVRITDPIEVTILSGIVNPND
jgi:hypothetical protein